ncbi:uncharacterized protein LOC121917103 isoform X5 [Sceloporus undulatus]|uniref:uncharacterized protein LOC121917103 isoform X5 n=1 Tax=Sceloporus undulatus TaxID=8520 RepID=UPI001C4BB534|nr:uncharacterized protein LOC121917103 isoform X5 [Sceloporus undulatus]
MDWDPLLDPRPFQGSWIGEIPGEREGEPQAPLGGTREKDQKEDRGKCCHFRERREGEGEEEEGEGASQQKRPRNPPPAMAEGNHKRLPLQPDDAPFRPLL